ncbi:alkaline phosphatase [uncultured Marinococcus sp.]|uniref:alkaline phosphatase n=1 Tax=uncultured Marinococcus sp. TaxID=487012 RepID=UPI002616FAEE|nr:alkaline phosphatase [uncultured Marinococcus sp.]
MSKWKRSTKAALLLGASGLVAGTAMASENDGRDDSAGDTKPAAEEAQAQNVILMVPDGFSDSVSKNYSLYKDGEPVWEERDMTTGKVDTSSADAVITDSAAAGTAYAIGERTNNGMIGMTPDGESQSSILDEAADMGKSTGLVATSTITHATPAVFASHVEDRNNYTEIAKQMTENENLDLMYGGGREHFLPESEGGIREDGENYIDHAIDAGFEYVETERAMDEADGDRIMGLFADDAMNTSLEQSPVQPSLSEMTSSAIDHLSQDEDGFFLMVEGSQIDWAGHANDPAWMMSDTAAFEQAVEEATAYSEEHEDTLVVVASDHDTGGSASEATVENHPSSLKNVDATGAAMQEQVLLGDESPAEVFEEHTGMTMTDEEQTMVEEAETLELGFNHVLSENAGIDWTSTNHTAVDITVFAEGPGEEAFSGSLQNTEVFDAMQQAMK